VLVGACSGAPGAVCEDVMARDGESGCSCHAADAGGSQSDHCSSCCLLHLSSSQRSCHDPDAEAAFEPPCHDTDAEVALGPFHAPSAKRCEDRRASRSFLLCHADIEVVMVVTLVVVTSVLTTAPVRLERG